MSEPKNHIGEEAVRRIVAYGLSVSEPKPPQHQLIDLLGFVSIAAVAIVSLALLASSYRAASMGSAADFALFSAGSLFTGWLVGNEYVRCLRGAREIAFNQGQLAGIKECRQMLREERQKAVLP